MSGFFPAHPGTPWLEDLRLRPGFDRERDRTIGEALGWRVSHDDWWNWKPGPVFDPPGDAWCIRKDGRLDEPCNEALPIFTVEILEQIIAETSQ